MKKSIGILGILCILFLCFAENPVFAYVAPPEGAVKVSSISPAIGSLSNLTYVTDMVDNVNQKDDSYSQNRIKVYKAIVDFPLIFYQSVSGENSGSITIAHTKTTSMTIESIFSAKYGISFSSLLGLSGSISSLSLSQIASYGFESSVSFSNTYTQSKAISMTIEFDKFPQGQTRIQCRARGFIYVICPYEKLKSTQGYCFYSFSSNKYAYNFPSSYIEYGAYPYLWSSSLEYVYAGTKQDKVNYIDYSTDSLNIFNSVLSSTNF